MAEIRIERKKKPVWPWILLLLLIAVIAWAIFEFTEKPDDVDDDEVPATSLVIPARNIPQLIFTTV